jgi:hypothetical protein
MKQEDYNDMMMTSEEGYAFRHPKSPVWNKCPQCGENYSGDGKTLCVDCLISIDNTSMGNG